MDSPQRSENPSGSRGLLRARGSFPPAKGFPVGILSALSGPRREVLPVHIEDPTSFAREVTHSDRPVIVDVWSDLCAPCKQLAPVMIDVATKYEGRVKVAEVNTAASPTLVRALGVSATPTILVFSRGREMGRVAGYHPGNWFDEMIEKEFPLDSEANTA